MTVTRSTVDCQCAIGRFSSAYSSFITQNIPILGAGADGAACAVFRDTPVSHYQSAVRTILIEQIYCGGLRR